MNSSKSDTVPKRSPPGPDAGAAGSMEMETIGLIDETIRLFFRLRRVADQIHRKGALSGGRRGVLRALQIKGPQTVPDMARSRAVTRQNAQVFVNSLLAEGLVEKIPNPAHKGSPLIQLTEHGKGVLDGMNQRELELMEALELEMSPEDIRNATAVLRALRKSFESDQWETLVQPKSSA